MSLFDWILVVVGGFLLVLALLSGVKLFQRASEGSDENGGSMGSLWFLFLVGIAGGLLLVWFGLNSSSMAGWILGGVAVVGAILGLMTLFA